MSNLLQHEQKSRRPERRLESLQLFKIIMLYTPFGRSFWHVVGYSETEPFGHRLLELPRAALGLPGEPQEPFRFHFGYIFGAILDPESKKGEKVKIELSPRRELNFEGPGRPPKTMKIPPFLATLFGRGTRTPQGGPVAVSGAKVDAKRVSKRTPFGPVFGFFGDPVSR